MVRIVFSACDLTSLENKNSDIFILAINLINSEGETPVIFLKVVVNLL